MKEVHVGMPIHVSATISLGKLSPTDVEVQVYFGTIDHREELINTDTQPLQLLKSEGKMHHYEGFYKCPENGKQGFTVRVLPTNPLLIDPVELYLCTWA